MEHQDKKLEIWKEAIPRMNEEDLEFILDFPECFDPKVLRMVKKRYTWAIFVSITQSTKTPMNWR